MRRVLRQIDSGQWLPVGVVLLATLAGCLRCIQIGQSLWLDELHTAWVVAGDWSEMPQRARLGHTSPLYYILPRLTAMLVASPELGLRLSSLISGVGVVVLTTFLAYRWTRSAGCACLAGLLLSLDPHNIFYAGEARVYAPLQLIALLQLAIVYRLWKRPTVLLRATYLAVSVAMVYLHYTAIWQLVALAGAYGCIRPARYRVRSWVLDQSILLCLCALELPSLVSLIGSGGRWGSFIEPISLRLLPFVFPALTLALVSLPFGLWRARRRRSVSRITCGWLALLPPLMALVLTNAEILPIFHARYVITASAPAAIAVSLWVRATPPAVRAAAVLVVLVAMGLTYNWDFTHVTNRNQDWRRAVEIVNADESLKVVFVRSGFMEAEHVRSDPRVVPLAICPVRSCYQINGKELVPLPAYAQPAVNDIELDRMIRAGGAFFVLCGEPDSIQDFVKELQQLFDQRGVSGHLKNFPLGDVSVLRVEMTRPP